MRDRGGPRDRLDPFQEKNIRNVEEAASYLEGLIDLEKRPGFSYRRLGLDPIRALTERLGEPQRGLRVVHIAGSKGKGSTALFAEAILSAAGLRVGTFTSPHLERWTERFRIDGSEVEGDRLAAAVAALRPHVDALRAGNPARHPTWFDATTAAALWLFRDAGVDVAILEVGLGGRLDSTNVVDPVVTCVTTIELEHTAQLGATLSEIAGEKAGILAPGVPAVTGDLPADAAAVVAARAAEVGAPLACLGRDFRVEVADTGPEGVALQFADGPLVVDVRVPVLGTHQAANVAVALAGLRRAGIVSDTALCDAAGRGLASVALPGRVEILSRAPWVVVDGAHTDASARALAAAIASLPRRRCHLVLSLTEGKRAEAVLAVLLPGADEVTLTRADPARSLAPAEVAGIARRIAPDVPLRVVPNPHLALRAARERADDADLLCVAGSIYLAGIARRVLRDAPVGARVAVTRRADRGPVAPA